MSQELQFNQKKRRNRELEAYEDGVLLEEEIGDLEAELPRFQARRSGIRLHRSNGWGGWLGKGPRGGKGEIRCDFAPRRENDRVRLRRRRLKPTATTAPSLRGRRAWVDQKLPDRELVLKALLEKGASRVDREDADLFITPSPTAPGQRIRWSAAIGRVDADALIVSSSFVLRGEGTVLLYRRKLHLKRVFWPSPAFLASHPVIAKLIHRKMALSGGAWQWCSRGSVEAARGAKAKSQVIVLTNRGEMFGSMAHIGHKFCAEGALAYFCTIDEQRCML